MKRIPWFKKIPSRPHRWKRRIFKGPNGDFPSRYWDCSRPGCGEFFMDMATPARKVSGNHFHRGTQSCRGKEEPSHG